MAEPAWSLGTLTARLAARHGGRTAALLDAPIPLPGFERRRRLTFADLEALVGRAAHALRRDGIGPGDRVAVVVHSELTGLIAALAAARAGGQPALLYGGLPDAETRPLLQAARASRVLGPGPEDLASLLEGSNDARVVAPDDGPGTGAILFTSGTTGTPKGVPLSDAGLEAALRFARLAPDLSIGRDDRAVAVLPLAHVYGLVLALAYLETRVPALYLPRFDASDVLTAISRVRASVFAGVPGMYRQLEEAGAGDADLRTVRLFVSGADAMPRDLARRFQRRGSSVAIGSRTLLPAFFVEGYGLVEATGPALFRALGPIGVMRKFRPVPGWRARAVGEDGEAVPPGETGTLELSGPGVVSGYLSDGGSARRPWSGSASPRASYPPEPPGERGRDREWLRTQDLATVSRTQAVEILGRSDDLLKVGGHRLHPGEVEAALLAHPAVADAGVTAAPHRTMGEVPAAAIVLRPGATVTPKELTAWAAKRLASYKVPRRIRVVESIPRTPTGKVKRADVRAWLDSGS